MSRTALILLRSMTGLILISMIILTVVAIREASLMEAGSALWKDAWFRLTLADAYFGFLIFYSWVFYKERTQAAKIVWFLLIMGLGNMAVSAYILIQLFKIQPGDVAESFLLRG
jgi:hypothetical protein